MARIGLVHPDSGGVSGNRVTALRWEGILRELGHECLRTEEWDGADVALLVALHARKSHASIVRFHEAYPERPLVVAAAGTELYGGDRGAPETLASFRAAKRIVLLQSLAAEELEPELRQRAVVIYQSMPLRERGEPDREHFDVCVLANVRPIKDALRAAQAARRLPENSCMRVLHLGQVLDENARSEVERERTENPRYVWLGERAHDEALDVLAKSWLLVSSSLGEGGANAVTEAIACGTPVLASDIPGARGILGDSYPGFFPVGDTGALTALLRRAEEEPAFHTELARAVLELRPLVDPAREREAWRTLLAEL